MSFPAKFFRWLSNEKAILYSGCIVFAIYFSLLFNFQQSRWLFTDSAFTFFRILNKEPLFFDRFSNFLQVWPAQLAVHFNLPATLVLALLNFTLPTLFFVSFLIFQYLRSPYSFIFPLLLFTGGPLFFFVGYNEILMAVLALGLAINFMFLSNKKIAISGLMVFESIMLLAHPASLILVPLLFLICIYYKKNLSGFLVFLPVLLFIFKSRIIGFNEYDQNLLVVFINKRTISNLINEYSWFYFKSTTYTWMLPSLTTLAMVFYLLIKSKQYKFTLLFLAFVLICLFTLLLIYHAGDATINMEKFFYPFAVICIVGLCFVKTKNKFRNFIILSVTVLCTVFSVFRINKESFFYTQRLNLIYKTETHYSAKKIHKVFINYSLLTDEKYGSTWGLPYETMLISALKNNLASVTVKTIPNSSMDKNELADSFFLGADFALAAKVSTLNPTYFHLPISPYFVDSNFNISKSRYNNIFQFSYLASKIELQKKHAGYPNQTPPWLKN